MNRLCFESEGAKWKLNIWILVTFFSDFVSFKWGNLKKKENREKKKEERKEQQARCIRECLCHVQNIEILMSVQAIWVSLYFVYTLFLLLMWPKLSRICQGNPQLYWQTWKVYWPFCRDYCQWLSTLHTVKEGLDTVWSFDSRRSIFILL